MQTSVPNAVMSHQSQTFSLEAKSVEFLTIMVHLARERPNPARAPYLKRGFQFIHFREIEITSISHVSLSLINEPLKQNRIQIDILCFLRYLENTF